MDQNTRDRIENRNGARSDKVPSLSLEESKVRMSDRLLIVLVAIAAVVGFTDLSFNVQSLSNFTALSVFLYFMTTVTYRNRYDSGKLKGRLSSEYVKASEEYEQAVDSIPSNISDQDIADYCEQYKERELWEYRRALLMPFRISEAEYRDKYLGMRFWKVLLLKEGFRFKRMIILCNNAKPVHLTPSMLLSETGEGKRSRQVLGTSGKQREKRDKTKQAVSKALMTLSGGAIVVSLLLDFSFQALAQWAVRLLPVVTAIISGSADGYENIAVIEAEYKRNQAKFINSMVDEFNYTRSEKGKTSETIAVSK